MYCCWNAIAAHNRGGVRYLLALLSLLMLVSCPALAEGYPESEHPYASNSDVTWTYTYPEEAYALKITFSDDTAFEANWDFLYITGEDGLQQKFTGTALQGETVYTVGQSVTFRLTSDGSVNKNGFTITAIEAMTQAEYEEYLATPRYTINSSGVITAYSGGVSELIVPDVINGITVSGIGSSVFMNNTRLTSVVLPDSVTSIGSYAFYRCSSMTSVSIPEGVTSIGSCAFRNCSSLTSIDLPAGLTKIANYTFDECSSLRGDLVIPDGVETVGEYAFYDCGFDGALSLPQSLTSIGEYAFSSCDFTGDLIIPTNVASVGEYAFWSCLSFDGSLMIPEGLTVIEDGAFSWCARLSGELVLPDSLQVIGAGAFAECFALSGDLSLPEGLLTLGENAFMGCSQLTGTVVIPQNVTTIPNHCFYDCSSLEGIVMYEGVTLIEENAFERCSKLASVMIPSMEIEIDAAAFTDTPALVLHLKSGSTAQTAAIENGWRYVLTDAAVIQPSDLTNLYIGWDETLSVQDSAGNKLQVSAWRSSDTSLASVTASGVVTALAEGTVTIEATLADGTVVQRSYPVKTSTDEAFFVYEVSNGEACITGFDEEMTVRHLVIPSTLGDCPVTEIADSAFRFADFYKAYIPASVEEIGDYYGGAFNRCFNLVEFRVEEGSSFYTIDGVLFRKGRHYISGCGYSQNSLIQYPYGRNETSYTVPDGTEALYYEAFEACDLTAIELPDSLKMLGRGAFSMSDIEKIMLPASLRYIGGDALSSMFYLTEIEVDEQNQYLKAKQGVLFNRSGTVLYAYPAGKSDEHYTVPDGVTTIEYGACSESQFRTITFPDTLTTIEWSAFSGSNLRKLEFPDSLTHIDGWAFTYSYYLEEVIIPRSVTLIDESAFAVCGDYSDNGFHMYFEHEPEDELTIVYDDVFKTIPDYCIVHAVPGSAAEQYALEVGLTVVSYTAHFWANGVLSDGEVTYTCLQCGETKTAAVVQGTPGDVNDDSSIDMLDIIDLLEWYCGGVIELNLANGEVNGDTCIDMLDIITLMQQYCGGAA